MIHTLSLKALSDRLRKKEFSSVELVSHYLERINMYDKTLNTFITVCEDDAIALAKKADQRIAAGTAAPLTGIPIAHKDIFCTHGVKTSCGSKMLDNFIAPYNATVVENFITAGTVMLGKTNMDEFAMGSSNENSFYGPVKNPWDITAVPGGSSGGSAAAVSARLSPAATGTDTGGSIRQPAALSGITGLKPTYGRVSRYGMIAFASSLDQAGPMAVSAEDCALLMNVMAGFDPKDSTSMEHVVPDYTAELTKSLQGKKVGLPKHFFSEHLDSDIADRIHDIAKQLEAMGATCVDIDLPHMHLAIPAYYVVAPAEASSNLARYDGVRFGYRAENPVDLTDLYKRTRAEGFGAEVKRRIMIGTYVLSSGYYDAYYVKAQQIRRLIHQDFQDAFAKVDVILGPATPSTAFAIGSKTRDPISMYLLDIYTVAVNLAGLPAISIPAGFSQGKPIGAQFIANHFDESLLLNVGHQLQQVSDWHQQIPSNFKE